MSQGLIDPLIFESLQTKIDEETAIRDKLRDIVQTLEKQSQQLFQLLENSKLMLKKSEVLKHSYQECILLRQLSAVSRTLDDLKKATAEQTSTVQQLAEFANGQPYYKYNSVWSRQLQDVITAILVGQWLRDQQLLTIDQVGETLHVPVNVKHKDEFHVTIEEYLQALISVIDELARLAVNSVTLGDYERPLQISKFIKEIHSGFQLLNLKNDSLRRRSDSIKYSVKKVEDVVYDLSLRNLIPKADSKMETS